MISKKARNDSKHVNTLTQNVIQHLIEGLIRKELTEKDVKLVQGNDKTQPNSHTVECNICNKMFPTKQGCLIHKGKAHVTIKQKEYEHISSSSKGEFVCKSCGEVRGSETTLQAYVEFKHNSGLKRSLSEMRSQPHCNINKYVCPKCEMFFNYEDDLKNHMNKHGTSPSHKKQSQYL